MPAVADVCRRYGHEYVDRFGQDLLPSHRRAIADLLACRTEALGGQLRQCARCGQEHYVDHSCRNRRCPTCHRLDTEAWLADRRRELLPVPYVHVVFTVPQELRELVRRHQRDRYDILLRAAAHARITLAADPHYVGGLIGVLCVLPTWSRTLAYHPHVHCLVPAGGALPTGLSGGQPARPTWCPSTPLPSCFADSFSLWCVGNGPTSPCPRRLGPKGGSSTVNPRCTARSRCCSTWAGTVHRIALTNSRMLSLESGHVCFRDQDAQDHRWQSMTLPALEFIRRFLQHVLPEGFPKVRYYGLWSPVHRSLRHQLQLWLARHAPVPPPASPVPAIQAPASWGPPLRAGQPCPSCGQGLLVVIHLLPRAQRGPP